MDGTITSTETAKPLNLEELQAIVGNDGVIPWDNLNPALQQNLTQAVTPETHIQAVVYPNTQEELAAVVAIAAKYCYRILPYGGGSKLHWGGLVENVHLAVSTERLNRLIEHAVGDLTVTVEAGMKFEQLQQTLAKVGQFIAIDPAYPQTATIGGIIATADTGSLRQRYRSVRDMVLGVSFIRSDGKIAKAGGRVVKNVAGYDLMKLLTGSYGTLGLISQVTLRLYPMALDSATVLLTGDAAAITQASQTLLSSALTPVAVDILSPTLIEKLELGSGLGLLVKFESITESVQQQSSRLLEVGEKLGLKGGLVNTDENDLWQQLHQQMSISGSNSQIICKIGVSPTAAIETLTQSQTTGWIHAGVGLGMLQFETVTAEELLNLRKWCEAKGGFLSVLAAPMNLKQKIDVWGYSGNGLKLMQQIKQQFDPNSIFSPHRFIGGI
ncbi:MAG: FAD-binding oxidoreductase [Microcoleaceae cyanobacterium]